MDTAMTRRDWLIRGGALAAASGYCGGSAPADEPAVARVTAREPFDILITGGRVVDGSGNPWFRADVGLRGDRIAAMSRLGDAAAKVRIDAAGKVVAPGFIDTHPHGDLMLLADPAHEPAIRQGVTTYILGQDGCGFAPASPTTQSYMRRYTAGFSGNPELSQHWTSVAEYLAHFDRHTALNVACLVPNGCVRMDVMGLEPRRPTADELRAMRRKVREGLEQGAVGLSSGLDYIPSRYADMGELTELSREIVPFDGVYVTHMRGYQPDVVEAAIDEVFHIGDRADCAVHFSHFNVRPAMALPKLDRARAEGIDATFDLYPYLVGNSVVGMVLLPPAMQAGGIEATLARLTDPGERAKLREWLAGPKRGQAEVVRFSHISAPEYRRYEGQTVAAAAQSAGRDVVDFLSDPLIACRMEAGCLVPHTWREERDIDLLMRHPAMMACSDGIFVGGAPHPRGWAAFARYLGYYVRQGTWTLEEAVRKLSAHAARRFRLKDRGLLREGFAADVIVFDPTAVRDRATFGNGRQLADGLEHVIVNGELVLHAGRRTDARPGRALRRS
jgi:N-acyl-D-amino-acid deacylase